ncbi:MAG TPA: ATP synthase F1 subunit epsilon [Candidatus Caccovicinus merdipullorum]|uniref:ATP synthase epsilon chain n=1 Tax=Candidatus Caccovicinus merdipullorum TaxID=2840724 RepID=A0A9D1GK35_9FIRM|nr:ATP synthase F1 subunit epsilon [Candidatus Caccovicinus merdipullorum]
MSTFWLKIVASDHVFFNGSCEALVVPAHDGEVGILPHREAMILAIQEGELRFRTPESNGQWRKAVVGLGIVQVANNRVTVIVDTAERPEDIDEVRAKQALERAEEQMRQKQSLREFKMSQASMVRAIARLKGKRESEYKNI